MKTALQEQTRRGEDRGKASASKSGPIYQAQQMQESPVSIKSKKRFSGHSHLQVFAIGTDGKYDKEKGFKKQRKLKQVMGGKGEHLSRMLSTVFRTEPPPIIVLDVSGSLFDLLSTKTRWLQDQTEVRFN